MLTVGLSEIILVIAAAALLLRPQDIPAMIRACATLVRQLRQMSRSMQTQINEVTSELEATTTIIDLEGNPQRAYDVSELVPLLKPKEPS